METGCNYLYLEYSNTVYSYNSEGRDVYELLGYDYSFTKVTEKNGEVKSHVRGGVITLTLSSLPTDNLFSWFLNTNKLATGEIVLNGSNMNKPGVMKFEEARCIGFRLCCNIQSQKPDLLLTIKASKIQTGDTEFAKL